MKKNRYNSIQPNLPLEQKLRTHAQQPGGEAGLRRNRDRVQNDKVDSSQLKSGQRTKSSKDPLRTRVASPKMRKLLLKAVLAGFGTGWRIQWLELVAADSERFGWTLVELGAAVADQIEWVNAQRPYAPNSADNVRRDGRLAGHPAVRNQVSRLTAIADEVVATQKSLPGDTVLRTYHALRELMRLERDPDTRCHSASVAAYTAYLQAKRIAKLSEAKKEELLPEPLSNKAPIYDPISAASEVSDTRSVGLIYEAVVQMIDALAQKSTSTGLPIRLLLDADVRALLRQITADTKNKTG